jgi:hypothetical protein
MGRLILAFGLLLVLFLSAPVAAGSSLTVSRLELPRDAEFSPANVSARADGRLIAFQANHPEGQGGHDIWMAELRDGRWSEPFNPGSGINTADQEYDARLTPDGRTLVFIRSSPTMRPSIFISRLVDGEWATAEAVGPPVSFPDTAEYGALLVQGGRRLYFSSNRSGGLGRQDVYYSDRTADGWSEPVNIGAPVNTEGDEVDAAVSEDESILILHLRREDSTNGSIDLYISRRENDRWSEPVNLGPRFNTPGNDTLAFLAADGRTLYMNSTWEGWIGGSVSTGSRWGAAYVFTLSDGFQEAAAADGRQNTDGKADSHEF